MVRAKHVLDIGWSRQDTGTFGYDIGWSEARSRTYQGGTTCRAGLGPAANISHVSSLDVPEP